MAKKLFFIVIVFLPDLIFAQGVNVEGYFMADSAKLGERIGYVLKATYPRDKQLIFPDSSFNYEPFVLLEKKTYVSSTIDSVTTDSTVYFVSNFALDSTVYLTLPVFELSRYDSVTHYPLEAALAVNWQLDSIPEQLAFQENNVYQPIPKNWNWILMGLILVLLLIALVGGYLLFGKRIKKYLSERNEKRRWKVFEKRWHSAVETLINDQTIDAADELLGLWKGYMETITKLPVREWTSSEVGEKLADIRIFSSLRSIEMIIYAGTKSEVKESSDYLLAKAKENYQEKLKNIKHDRAVV
ncbi:hypothetical protein OU792_01815 [Algoriphagus sp. NF]|uniref:hypothetical protein n=1 Tax=Algoriphagus sp. NF TaxID=2992756 RepID=UPI001066C198|nr:hypothetical protein [Algoriphagus sp. NF]MDE0558701.1 hypothetical protein [Algoriphagus sp. NF]